MPKTITVNIPANHAELSQLQAEAAAAEQERARNAIAAANRKRLPDVAEPKPDSTLLVAARGAWGNRQRRRAGLQFTQGAPTEVKVIDADDAEVARQQATGAAVVNVRGAEEIIADANGDSLGLVLFSSRRDATALDLDDRSEEELEAALARKRARVRGAEPRLASSKKADASTADARTTEATTATTPRTGKTEK